jgi:hypothetical protein
MDELDFTEKITAIINLQIAKALFEADLVFAKEGGIEPVKLVSAEMKEQIIDEYKKRIKF